MANKEPFRAETAAALLKTLLFTVLVPLAVCILVPYWVLSSKNPQYFELGAIRYAGILFISLGGLSYLWCGWDFAVHGRGTPAPIDPPKELVVRGLYHYVRNPMYVGVLSVLLGESLLFQTVLQLKIAIAFWGGFHLFVRFYEEPVLRKKFGEAYQNYCHRVPRWIPRWRRIGTSMN
jgi:protein-S-isoprenylcysteine O-methyltransferase Ste14